MPKEVIAVSPGATWNDITGPSRPKAASSPGPHRFRGLRELNIQIISALQMSPKPLIMTSWRTEGAERNRKWQTYPLSAFCSFQVFLTEARHFFSAYFSTVLLAITKDYIYIYMYIHMLLYNERWEDWSKCIRNRESWAFKLMRCQSLLSVYMLSEKCMDHGLLGGRDREQNKFGRTTSPVKFMEMRCAWHSASIIYLLLDVVSLGKDRWWLRKYKQKQRVSKKVSKTTPAHFKSKRNITKIKSNVWQLVSPPPQFNSDSAPLVFRDGFSKGH